MPTPETWYSAAKRYLAERKVEEQRQHEQSETVLAHIVDPDILCWDCQQKVMRG